MGILNALGLMTRAEHDRLVLRIESDRDKFRDQVRDTAARAEKAEKNLRAADNQTKAAIASRDEWKAKFNTAAKDLEAQAVELAGFHAKRDRDNAGRRARRERDAAATNAARAKSKAKKGAA